MQSKRRRTLAAAIAAAAIVALLPAGAGAAPARHHRPAPRPPAQAAALEPGYTIEQAISDRAQLSTVAFSALGFLTGNIGSDSFFPPGKVADFWGFQYLRDNDPSQMGHNTDFLTRAATNVLATLTAAQRAQLVALANSQVDDINSYAMKRFTFMAAFRRLLAKDLPSGTTGLSRSAVLNYSATLYQLDGAISRERAAVMGPILSGLTATQRAALDAMVGHGMTSWPVVPEPEDLRGLGNDQKVAVMTYASDMFSWYAGSVTADTYFCPERHGTYYGSFYLKDAPAVGNPDYSISTTITGDMGAALLGVLTPAQQALISDIITDQRADLEAIVDVRGQVATLLRGFRSGSRPSAAAVNKLMTRYGQLDGSLNFRYTTAVAEVGQTLTDAQRAQLMTMRQQLIGDLAPAGAFLYSSPIPMPPLPGTDFLFR
jgi:hypothetical protein